MDTLHQVAWARGTAAVGTTPSGPRVQPSAGRATGRVIMKRLLWSLAVVIVPAILGAAGLPVARAGPPAARLRGGRLKITVASHHHGAAERTISNRPTGSVTRPLPSSSRGDWLRAVGDQPESTIATGHAGWPTRVQVFLNFHGAILPQSAPGPGGSAGRA